MKLNLGSGNCPLDGYVNLDAKNGCTLFPVRQAGEDGNCRDNAADEVRASHVLEHFPHGQTLDVLKEWVRVLKPGGWLKIAVPDFDWILNARTRQIWDGKPSDSILESYLFGGQTDENDYHKALFDRRKLEELLYECGLVNLRPWTSEIQDCASLPVSLNLMGQKPFPRMTPSEFQEFSDLIRPEPECSLSTAAPRPTSGKCKHGLTWYGTFGVEAYCCMCCGIQLAHGKPGYCAKCLYEESQQKPEAQFDKDRIYKIDPKVKLDAPPFGLDCKTATGRIVEALRDVDFAKPKSSPSRTQVFAAGHWQDLFDGANIDVADEAELAAANAGQLQTRTIVSNGKRAAKIALCLSTPRQGFLRPFERLLALAHQASISVFSGDGVFWHHALSRSIQNAVEFDFEDGSDGFDFILTADYDTYAVVEDIKALAELLARSPEADCIVPMQMKRGGTGEILAGGHNMDLTKPLVPIETGHFGLTIFRKSFFERMPKPWFYEKPDVGGHWGEGRIDADIGFWLNAKKAKLSVMLAPGIVAGHGEELITYPRIVNGKPEKVYQAVNDWLNVRTKPEGIGVQ